jgi:hypothetical protein
MAPYSPELALAAVTSGVVRQPLKFCSRSSSESLLDAVEVVVPTNFLSFLLNAGLFLCYKIEPGSKTMTRINLITRLDLRP